MGRAVALLLLGAGVDVACLTASPARYRALRAEARLSIRRFHFTIPNDDK